MGGMGAMFHDKIKKVVDNAVCKMQFAEGSCPEASVVPFKAYNLFCHGVSSCTRRMGVLFLLQR